MDLRDQPLGVGRSVGDRLGLRALASREIALDSLELAAGPFEQGGDAGARRQGAQQRGCLALPATLQQQLGPQQAELAQVGNLALVADLHRERSLAAVEGMQCLGRLAQRGVAARRLQPFASALEAARGIGLVPGGAEGAAGAHEVLRVLEQRRGRRVVTLRCQPLGRLIGPQALESRRHLAERPEQRVFDQLLLVPELGRGPGRLGPLSRLGVRLERLLGRVSRRHAGHPEATALARAFDCVVVARQAAVRTIKSTAESAPSEPELGRASRPYDTPLIQMERAQSNGNAANAAMRDSPHPRARPRL